MKRIRIFHQKLPTAQKAGLGTQFHPEFILNLKNAKRQIFVRKNMFFNQRRDHFLVSRPQSELAATFIFDSIKIVHRVPAAGFFPVFFRLERGHQNFLAAGFFHFFPDNRFNFFKRAKTQRQKSVNSGHQFVYKTGARKKRGIFRNLVFRGVFDGFSKKF